MVKSGMSIVFDNASSIRDRDPFTNRYTILKNDARNITIDVLCASRMLNLEVFMFQVLRSGLVLLFFRSVSIISNMIAMLILEKILLIKLGCVGLEV